MRNRTLMVLADLRYACRALGRMPGVSAVVVASLAVGIGVNTIVFSWIQAFQLLPLSGLPIRFQTELDAGGLAFGRRLQVRGRGYTIAGVVRTSLSNAFGEPPTPAVYLSYRDNPSATGEIHVRVRGGPGGPGGDEHAVAPASAAPYASWIRTSPSSTSARSPITSRRTSSSAASRRACS
jgi:hypothetical protein